MINDVYEVWSEGAEEKDPRISLCPQSVENKEQWWTMMLLSCCKIAAHY